MNSPLYQVTPIAAFNDNYIWLITEPTNQYCVVVDPGDASVVLKVLTANNLTLAAILVTHHHQDHIGGVSDLVNKANKTADFAVYGPSQEAQSVVGIPLIESQKITIKSMQLHLQIVELPGHTLGHIAYYDQYSVFCGDTLFAGGCGRMFEGTPQQMHQSLENLAALPPSTKVYCAHEYTLANLAFAKAVEPNNDALAARIEFCQQQRVLKQPTIPSTIGEELATNPFLRTNHRDVIAMAQQKSQQKSQRKNLIASEVFGQLRQWKDTF